LTKKENSFTKESKEVGREKNSFIFVPVSVSGLADGHICLGPQLFFSFSKPKPSVIKTNYSLLSRGLLDDGVFEKEYDDKTLENPHGIPLKRRESSRKVPREYRLVKRGLIFV
jgi:hypothetical protein